MRNGLMILLVAVGFLSEVSPAEAQSRVFYVYDADGTLVEHRAEYGGTFSTPYKLFLVNRRNFSTQISPQTSNYPEVIEVDQDQFEKLEKAGAYARDGQLGNLTINITTTDGKVVPAGLYQISSHFAGGFNTYQHYQTVDGLVRDIKTAEKNDPTGKWKGFAWERLVYLLSLGKKASVHALSARIENPGLYKYLKAPKQENQIWLGGDDADRFGREHGIAHMKAQAFKEFVSKVQKIPFDRSFEKPILNADGDKWVEAFTVVIDENDPANLLSVLNVAIDLARRKKWDVTPVKFVVLNAGTEEELTSTGLPRIAVVTSSGNLRPATDEEVFGHWIKQDDITPEVAAKLRLPSSFGIEAKGLPTRCSSALKDGGEQ